MSALASDQPYSTRIGSAQAGVIVRRHADSPAPGLIALAHGLFQGMEDWEPLIKLLATDPAFDNWDLLLLNYPLRRRAGLQTNSADLSEKIELSCSTWNYREILLVGDETGGLVARRAYTLARGAASEQRSWAGKLTRIVLLSTPNGGYEFTGPFAFFIALLAPFLRRSSRSSIFDVMYGSEFLTRLSLDWVGLRAAAESWPEVVQIAATFTGPFMKRYLKDDIALPDSKVIEIANVDYLNFKKMAEINDLNYQLFRLALFGPSSKLAPPAVPVTQPSAIVFLVHGIRDYGDWLVRLEQRIKKVDPRVLVIRKGYDYFNLRSFLLPHLRRRRIRWFCGEYTRYLALYPNVPIHFAGHSYGTYLLAHTVRKFRTVRFGRVYFAGSVVPRDYRWDKVMTRQQVAALRVDYGAADWPVGFLCSALSDLGYRDVGPGGFHGFNSLPGQGTEENKYFAGGHSSMLADGNLDSVAAYLINGHAEPIKGLVHDPDPRLSRFSKFALPIVIAVLAAVAALIASAAWYLIAQQAWMALSIFVMTIFVSLSLVLRFL